LNFLSRVKPALLLSAGAFLALAPVWVPHIQKVGGHNLFATPASMVLLGITLLASLLAYYLLTDSLVAGLLSLVSGRPPLVSRPAIISRFQFPIFRFLFVVCGLSSLVLFFYWVNQHILHSFLSSADEHSCYFLAECLRKGKLYVDIPPLADFFKVVHVGMRSGKWFSVYPPGWPLIWAVGLQFNIVDWLNPVLSALSVFFFYLSGIRLFSRWAVAGGLILMCMNPFFAFTAASYFSHATCLLCISVFLYAFLRWREGYVSGRDPLGWAALCALAVGYGLMTRYLTMAAVVGPFLLYHYLPIFFCWKGTGTFSPNSSWLRFLPFTFKRPRLRKSDWIVLGIIAIFMALILYQNYLVTGKAFRAPNKHDKSWERLGFRKDYTPVDGFFYLIARVFYLMDWFAPAVVALYLVMLLLGVKDFFCCVILRAKPEESQRKILSATGRRTDPSSGGHCVQDDDKCTSLRQLFRLSMVFIAFAYFFYYSWGGNQWGPRYLWEGMPFLCIAVADWIVSVWRNGSLRMRKFLLAFVVMSLVTSGMIFARQAEYVEESSRQRRALYDLAEKTAKGPAIVFIHGFLGSRLVMAEEDAVRNSPFLDGRILYAHDLGERNGELMAAYSGREYYRGSYDGNFKQPRLEKF